MRLGLERSLLSTDDLLLADRELLALLEQIEDGDIKALLNQLMTPVQLMEDNEHFDFHLVGKKRIIDVPVCLDGNSCTVSSLLSDEIRRMNEAAIYKTQQGTFVRIIQDRDETV
ncbi:hypothetical protein D3C77_653640 [compost metagenome]